MQEHPLRNHRPARLERHRPAPDLHGHHRPHHAHAHRDQHGGRVPGPRSGRYLRVPLRRAVPEAFGDLRGLAGSLCRELGGWELGCEYWAEAEGGVSARVCIEECTIRSIDRLVTLRGLRMCRALAACRTARRREVVDLDTQVGQDWVDAGHVGLAVRLRLAACSVSITVAIDAVVLGDGNTVVSEPQHELIIVLPSSGLRESRAIDGIATIGASGLRTAGRLGTKFERHASVHDRVAAIAQAISNHSHSQSRW